MNQVSTLDRFRGCLLGGAAGDALGYAVEFKKEPFIFETYGLGGIREYDTAFGGGKAIISDDTQMTLFTLTGLLLGIGRLRERGIAGDPRHYVLHAYIGWLYTQQRLRIPEGPVAWASYMLRDVKELYELRAPGNTCLAAMFARRDQVTQNRAPSDFIAGKLNESKGCGGVMRVAPLGLAAKYYDEEKLLLEGAQLAAITHGHSLGYIPAAAQVDLIRRIVYAGENKTLHQLARQTRDAVARVFRDDPHIGEFTALLDLAITLSENRETDLDNIHTLGAGWVGDEAFAIALYCSLRYPEDLSAALVAAVNHDGDSDSTGAITGNILGARLGYQALDKKWTKDLELSDLILNAAEALYNAINN